MRVYLAGPMSGIPNFNFHAFDEAAGVLRRAGHDVVSPAELDSPEFRAQVLQPGITGNETDLGLTWGDCLARDVKLIADGGIERIVFLFGWTTSRGARLEAFVGLLCGLQFCYYSPYSPGGIHPVSRIHVRNEINRSLQNATY